MNIKYYLFCFSLITNLAYAEGGELSTQSVIQATLKAIPHCFHYKVIGACFWQNCTTGGCTITSTTKVEHYLPDLVVSVFRNKNSNPWDYARTIVDPSAAIAGNIQLKRTMNVHLGDGNEEAASIHDTDTHFKEVDIIGNPAIPIFSTIQAFVLPSTAKPFVPYYLSMVDAYAWRSPQIESKLYPQYLFPGIRIVGSLINNWGSVFPRTGFLMQPMDAKAAAVMAQRAADIVTHSKQPHIYKELSSNCGVECHAAEAKENDENTKWQMVYPSIENKCVVFGEDNPTPISASPWRSATAQKGNGNYVCVLWRHSEGCVQREGKYIGNVNF